ncbi:hypothetical protein [Arcanobacterium phocae]|uniref:hypothetical protein n=1 Tax=Arcanobacterium phocae TaxID=131112 RepID=UPI001C0F19FF|nr:hypothetical protein [Arcanobacterium phocae]
MNRKLGRGCATSEIIARATIWNIVMLIIAGMLASIVLAIGGLSRSVLSVILGFTTVAVMHVISFLLERYVLSRERLVGMLAVCGYVMKIGVIVFAYMVAVKVAIFDVRVVALALVFGIISGLFIGTSVVLHNDGPPIGE